MVHLIVSKMIYALGPVYALASRGKRDAEEIEIKGIPFLDHQGRKAVTAKKCKLIHAEETE